MNLGIKGKRALITGGSHGIGLAIAIALAQEGCNIIICSRDKDKLTAAHDLIKRSGKGVSAIQCDVSMPEDMEKAILLLLNRYRGIDILINNVGGGGRWGSPRPHETEEKVWQEVYEKNAGAAIKFTMAFLPHMVEQKWGRIVTISSIYGKEGGGRPWFNMAKAAQISLMKTLAMNSEYARAGITFNTVAPGNVMIPDTGWAQEAREKPKRFKKFCDELPSGRLGAPEEVASIVTFLCSQQASLVNGACITVDGGESKSF